jgi:hypothetical protein
VSSINLDIEEAVTHWGGLAPPETKNNVRKRNYFMIQ